MCFSVASFMSLARYWPISNLVGLVDGPPCVWGVRGYNCGTNSYLSMWIFHFSLTNKGLLSSTSLLSFLHTSLFCVPWISLKPFNTMYVISVVRPTRCTNISSLFYFWNDTQVSDGPSIQHQELKTVHTVLNSWWWTERQYEKHIVCHPKIK